MSKTDFDLVHLNYSNIYNLICFANRIFHLMLFIKFTVSLAKVLNACHFIIFKREHRTIYRISPISLFAKFAFMWIFSVSVNKCCLWLQIKHNTARRGVPISLNGTWENARLFYKMNNECSVLNCLETLSYTVILFCLQLVVW